MKDTILKTVSIDEATHALINVLQNHCPIPIPTDYAALCKENILIDIFLKNNFYCKEGMDSTKTGLLISGNAKAYSTNEKGVETLIKFFLPGDFVSADNAHTGTKSDRTIVFLENAFVITIKELPEVHAKSMVIFPELSSIYMSMYQIEMANVRKISYMRSIRDAKEKIKIFYRDFAVFDNHFSSSDIASFIGIARETFSRYKNEVLKEM